MKSLFSACLILAALFGASITNAVVVTNVTDEIHETLSLSQQAAQQEDWDTAHQLLARAQETWETHNAYLHTMVNHDELDEAESLFAEIGQYAKQQDANKYCTFSECLAVQLDHIQETQQLSIQNVL